MKNYIHTGVCAFGDDRGTFSPMCGQQGSCLDLPSMNAKVDCRRLIDLSHNRPIIWFVDDELGNREWFRDYHRDDFSVVTFSSRAHFKKALTAGFPCDAIVTDIFFPAQTVETDDHAEKLLAIYGEIDESRVKDLPMLWSKSKALWSLDGFLVARDAASVHPPIPCFLFSRKATMLLSVNEYLGEPLPVGNSMWLLEKVAPTSTVETARIASQSQTARVLATLGIRRSKWRKLLDSLSIGPSGPSVSLKELFEE